MRLVDFLDKGASLHPSGAPCLMMSGLPDGIGHRTWLTPVTPPAAPPPAPPESRFRR
jgi:hypothetical protein